MSYFDLAELQAKGVPRVRIWDVVAIKDPRPLTKEQQEEADEMEADWGECLKAFAAPTEGLKCLGCGWGLGGFFGSFTWGLVNGEGRCSRCSYPARAHHRPKEGGFLEFVLQYHPDELKPATPSGHPEGGGE